MAMPRMPLVPLAHEAGVAASQRVLWRNRPALSSIGSGLAGRGGLRRGAFVVATRAERFLAGAGFDRAPWLVVALAGGIAAWFALPSPAYWLGAILLAGALALLAWLRREWAERYPHLAAAMRACGLLFALGVALIWARSEMVGTPALDRPLFVSTQGRVLERIEQPALARVRLVLAIRHPATAEPIRVRVNLPLVHDQPAIAEGALIAFRARLMPPNPPLLPGAYDFALTAWFAGLAATGSVQGPVQVLAPAAAGSAPLARWQRQLSAHVRGRLAGSVGSLAATFASGDRGAIAPADAVAMRDSGLTHLLSISGLHVSAVIGAAYFLMIRLLALWPWLSLRVRLPVIAAGFAALAGIGYTLLTGAEVPTVRSCFAALLVLGALVLGREPLSLRMLAVAAAGVLLLWPESLAGPSFQMSFCAVIAIIALHNAAPVQAFLAPREESWAARQMRRLAILFLTGLVIEIALMPVVLFHFHRTGVYGAFANVLAIPLVTFITMPLIALALALDVVGAGAPVWWLVGKSLDLMLGIAHFTASRPGAVRLIPQMDRPTIALFVAGGLWLGLWKGQARLLGLIPAALAALMLLATPVPDILISGDGRHVGITGEDDRLLVLRDTRSAFTRENLLELAGMRGEPLALAQWPGARCSPEFCSVTIERGGREWHLLLARNRERVEEDALALACARSDIVVADRWLPRSCRPRWIKADGRALSRTGGMSIALAPGRVRTVAATQGEHGWWRGRD